MMSIEERSLRFTPKVSPCFCMARVWNGGQGGQCPMMPTVQGFGLCKTHADRHAAEGLAHGRVDGPIPLEKLEEFEHRAGQNSSEAPSASPSPLRPVERSPSRTPRRVSAKTPPSTPEKMPPTTPAKTPPATPKKIRGPIVPLKEGVQRCHARIWAQGRGGQCNRRPCDGSKLCRIHQADAAKHDGVPVHGFIDGEIPPVKLEEFLRIAGKNGWELASPDAPSIKIAAKSTPNLPLTGLVF
mmetsp:Transcript_146148/g.207164  ORF Transcript_146148/g.207164 Transcript_146148/m.207164 type:complete len:241 (-) Transcript_146148:89-811(-)